MFRNNQGRRNQQKNRMVGRDDCCGQRRQNRHRQQSFSNRNMETIKRPDQSIHLDKESLLNKKEELLSQLDEVNLHLANL